jgi:hypothetical protein
MKTKFDWEPGIGNLPNISQEALKRYFVYGLEPGSFLIALLCDRPWTEVMSRADHWNKSLLADYLYWLQEHAPAGSWGSEQAVRSWLNKGPAYEQFQKTLMWETLKADAT